MCVAWQFQIVSHERVRCRLLPLRMFLTCRTTPVMSLRYVSILSLTS